MVVPLQMPLPEPVLQPDRRHLTEAEPAVEQGAWARRTDPSFTGQPGVVNGASELLGKAFGDAGVHARSAVGVAVLPLDAPVEVEIVVTVED